MAEHWRLRGTALSRVLVAAAVALCCSGACAFLAVPAHGRQSSRGEGGAGGRAALVSPADAPAASWARVGSAVLALGALVIRRQASDQAVQVPLSWLPRDQRPKGSKKVIGGHTGQRLFSVRFRHFWDYVVHPRTYFWRRWRSKDVGYAAFIAAVHLGALAAPLHFTKSAFAVFLVGYLITGLGITLSYHRQLAHRSFKTPKLLEYAFAYCGALALQSHPINWVSSHRHHHGNTETEKDVHSPLDGFWWSHCGWLMDQEGTWMRADKSNATDLSRQWFYRHLQKHYFWHAIALPMALLYAAGGLPWLLWGFFFRVVWVWHVTWCVNSVSHVWGFKDWNTPDNSMNNWIVGIFALGEGWHNNHHAFENSCRHGLKWWQVDLTWYIIKALSFVGLASHLNYPSEGRMRRLSFDAA